MKPVAPPEIPGTIAVVYAEDQPEYLPLPVRRSEDGELTTEWELDAEETARLMDTWARTGKVRIRVTVLTFNHPLQPLRVEVP